MKNQLNGDRNQEFIELSPVHQDYDIVFGVAPEAFVDLWWKPLVEAGYRIESDFGPYASLLLNEAEEAVKADALAVSGGVFEPNCVKPVASVDIHSWKNVPDQKIVQVCNYDFSVLRTLIASGLEIIGPPSTYGGDLITNSFQIAGASIETLPEWFAAHGLCCKPGKNFGEYRLALQDSGTEWSVMIGNYWNARNGEVGTWIGPIDIRVKSPSRWRPSRRSIFWPEEISTLLAVKGSRLATRTSKTC